MSLIAHIVFYNSDSRLPELVRCIEGIKTIPDSDVIVHTNALSDSLLLSVGTEARVIAHDISIDRDPKRLCWHTKCAIIELADRYDYTLYIEHDFYFSRINFEYYQKYHSLAKTNRYYLNFTLVELSHATGEVRFTGRHIGANGDFKPIEVCGLPFLTSDGLVWGDMCSMWILDKDELYHYIHDHADFFINAKSEYGIGFYVMESNAISPIRALYGRCLFAVDPGVAIHHMPNKYSDMEGTVNGKRPLSDSHLYPIEGDILRIIRQNNEVLMGCTS